MTETAQEGSAEIPRWDGIGEPPKAFRIGFRFSGNIEAARAGVFKIHKVSGSKYGLNVGRNRRSGHNAISLLGEVLRLVSDHELKHEPYPEGFAALLRTDLSGVRHNTFDGEAHHYACIAGKYVRLPRRPWEEFQEDQMVEPELAALKGAHAEVGAAFPAHEPVPNSGRPIRLYRVTE